MLARSLSTLGMALLGVQAVTATPASDDAGERDDLPSLREQLTEREDENRVEDPYSIEVAGRPLTISGEYELLEEFYDELVFDGSAQPSDQLYLENGLETELFYSFGRELSLFAQLRAAGEHDLHDGTPDRVSDVFIERGEMWLASERIGGSGWSVEIGSLDFEDDRLWWWDEDLDALRVTWEGERLEFAAALAREVLPRRSDRGYIEPEHDQVSRLILESSWDWRDEHALEAFALWHQDGSRPEFEQQRLRFGREDESDARLRFFGLRASGAVATARLGSFAYWADAAWVRGSERVAEYEVDEDVVGYSIVDATFAQAVRGSAMDLGATWLWPARLQPRLTLSYAQGSGDRDDEDGVDRAFRQTGVHANEIGFGGVQRFHRYGLMLDPELSNLGIGSLGVGISLLKSSSLDLLWNRYRLRHPADELRDARLELELDEQGRDLGEAVDLVLALEEWERVELEFTAAAFKPGRAVLGENRDWVWGGLLALRVAF